MTSKLKLNEVVLTSPNGLVEKSITMGDDGIVKVNGVQVADIVSGLYNVTDISGAGLTFTYTEQGSYIKIGKLVILNFDITFPANSSTAFAYISLPFPSATSCTGIIGYRDFADVVMMYGQNFYRDVGAYTNQLLQGRRLAGTLIYTATA